MTELNVCTSKRGLQSRGQKVNIDGGMELEWNGFSSKLVDSFNEQLSQPYHPMIPISMQWRLAESETVCAVVAVVAVSLPACVEVVGEKRETAVTPPDL